MPLIHSKSKKALGKNIATEMRAHPDKRKQNLAIAFSVQRQAKKKKMAEGGSISANNEKRPMPNDLYNDSLQSNQNRGDKPSRNDSWTDRSTEAQATANDVRGKKLPIKRPKMVPTNAFSTRLYDQEGQLEESASPGPYDAQPASWHDEEDAKKMGKSPDMTETHSTHRKPYAKGGEVESKDYDHPSNKYEQDLNSDTPSENEGSEMAMSHNEMDADEEGYSPDMAPEHSNGRRPYADGGEIGRSMDDSEDQPMEEASEEHHNSITAAIMARRDRLHAEIDSGAHDMDTAVRMAEGGILSHDSIYSDDSSQADLSRDHDEDANEEDQLSFNALRKENYNSSNLDVENPSNSAQMGDDEEEDSENKHDMIGSIRRKMRTKRQFSQD